MSISAIGGCTAAPAQATQYRSTSNTSNTATSATGAVQDGSSFINAIASALSDIGVTQASSTDAATGSSDAATDPAKALGDFLHTLMDTLHSQGGGEPQGHGGPHGAGGRPPPSAAASKGDGAGSDLQSLIASLDAASTDTEKSTDTENSTTASLSASFKNLLGALGVDNADAGSKLGQFLQTLSAKLESSGPAGNVINTTA